MSYRGEDIDLRTPQTWSATSAEAGPRGLSSSRSGPIWVDDTILSCSNHAYDVALAHRAAEVRLEHLLHALTRIDASAEALEARGVRVAALRRETAGIVASEIPVGLPNGKGMPRRSEEFAEVLRLAAANAARRNAPAAIEDLLYVLFDKSSEYPGLSLLARHTPRTTEPLPRYFAEPRYTIPERVVVPERVVMPERIERVVRVPEPVRYIAEPPRMYRSEFEGTTTDTIQNTRIEALEQMVRALSTDLANERQVVSGLIKDLSQETRSQRDDQGRFETGLQERLINLEQIVRQTGRDDGRADGMMQSLQGIQSSIEQRLVEMNRSWSILSDRLQGLEVAVRDKSPAAPLPSDLADKLRNAVDLKPIANRLDIIEEALLSAEPRTDGDVSNRLRAIETEIGRALSANSASTSRVEALFAGLEKSAPSAAMTAPVVERVNALMGHAQSQQAALNDGFGKVSERLIAVEKALAGEIETSAAKHQAYAQDLSEVHDALMKLNQNQHTLAGSIDQWRTDAAGDLSVISNRVMTLNRDNDRPTETLNALTAHMDTMNKLMVERYHRRNRFWYWLFGTDDWIGASWPSQAAAMEAERRRLSVNA